MSLSENAIPQLVIQEVDIPEGDNNYIEQVINQDIIIHVLEIPDLENTIGIQSFIQTDSDIGTDNLVAQNIHQATVDFPLFPNNYSPSKSKYADSNNLSLDFDDFINSDNILDTVQSINQQALVEGNSNTLDFYSEQIIYDLSAYDEFGIDLDYVFDENIAFDDALENFTSSSLLDSVQLGVQDVRVFGDDNEIIQELDQTIDTFIILDEDYSQELTKDSEHLSPVQFAFQESFLDEDDNIIEQNINQSIKFDFSLSEKINDELIGTRGAALANPEFSIDDFVLSLLENNDENSDLFENHEVLADQKNQQTANIFGNENDDLKENSQIIFANKGEIKELVLENPDRTLEAGLTDYFDELKDFNFNDSDNSSISDLLSDAIDSIL